jgi:CRISPR-associated endonuclease/helicase Cas3
MDEPAATQDQQFLAHLEENGKRQLLLDHLRSVSLKAGSLSAKIGIGPAGAVAGLAHDLGKYSSAFQCYLRSVTVDQDTEQGEPEHGKVDHSTAGAQIIWRRLKGEGALEGVVGEILSLCVASHHSGLIDCIAPIGSDKLSHRMLKADYDSHRDEAWSNAEPALREMIEQRLGDPSLVQCLKDRIAKLSQGSSNESIVRFKLGLLVRILFSCLIDADRTDTADFSSPAAAAFRQHGKYVEWQNLCGLLERSLKGFTVKNRVDELRKSVSDHCLESSKRPRGTFTLTVPTGGGKTLSSLRFALNHSATWNMDRIIYVSPYTSIIDQNADVVRKILEPKGSEFASVVLEHHSNLTPLKQTWRSKILAENWDAPIVFTTMVQLLETLFGPGTRAVRRMHQMVNAVLIFDEVQTLPVRCVHLFNNAVNYLVGQCGSSVVLCTATQPLLHRVDAAKGAIVLSDKAELVHDRETLFGALKRYEAYDCRKAGGWEHQEAAQLAHSEAKQSGSCLVVVNTKKEAHSIFKKYEGKADRFAMFHLSTNMCPAHRVNILEEVKAHIRDERSVVCISTQLIEAGVDIDFGSVIRALAGLDSIAQAAGRCNRHGMRDMGRVHIINLAGELPKELREIRLAQEAAQRVLDECSGPGTPPTIDLSNPELTERYFQYCFFDRRKEMSYSVRSGETERDDDLLNMLGENRLAVAEAKRTKKTPQIFLRQSFMSASKAFEPIEANTRGVIVPYGDDGKAVIADLFAAFEVDKQFKLLKRAQQFTVEVFPHVMRRLEEAQAVREVQPGTGVLCLSERYYNKEFGLSVDGSEEMELQHV